MAAVASATSSEELAAAIRALDDALAVEASLDVLARLQRVRRRLEAELSELVGD